MISRGNRHRQSFVSCCLVLPCNTEKQPEGCKEGCNGLLPARFELGRRTPPRTDRRTIKAAVIKAGARQRALWRRRTAAECKNIYARHPFGFTLPLIHFGSRKTEFSKTGSKKFFPTGRNAKGSLSVIARGGFADWNFKPNHSASIKVFCGKF